MDLAENIAKLIVQVILNHKRPEKIVLFGSRAEDRATATSDIDLAIFGSSWSDQDVNLLRAKLEEEIKTPFKIDLVHFESLEKEALKKNILRKGLVLYES